MVHPSDKDAPDDSDDNNKGRSGGISEPNKTPSTTTTRPTASMTTNIKSKSGRIWEPKLNKKYEKKMNGGTKLNDAKQPPKKEKGLRRVEETIKLLEPVYMNSLANCEEEQQREKKKKWEYMVLLLESYARSSTDKI